MEAYKRALPYVEERGKSRYASLELIRANMDMNWGFFFVNQHVPIEEIFAFAKYVGLPVAEALVEHPNLTYEHVIGHGIRCSVNILRILGRAHREGHITIEDLRRIRGFTDKIYIQSCIGGLPVTLEHWDTLKCEARNYALAHSKADDRKALLERTRASPEPQQHLVELFIQGHVTAQELAHYSCYRPTSICSVEGDYVVIDSKMTAEQLRALHFKNTMIVVVRQLLSDMLAAQLTEEQLMALLGIMDIDDVAILCEMYPTHDWQTILNNVFGYIGFQCINRWRLAQAGERTFEYDIRNYDLLYAIAYGHRVHCGGQCRVDKLLTYDEIALLEVCITSARE